MPNAENAIWRFEGFYFADGNVPAEKRKIDFWGVFRASTPHIAPNKMGGGTETEKTGEQGRTEAVCVSTNLSPRIKKWFV